MDTVCRLCLASDVKLHNLRILRDHPLEEHLETIIGLNPMTMVDLANAYACFECFALIKKFHTFREKCIVGQTTLCDLVYYKDDISQADIQSVDRNRLKLTSNLGKCTLSEDSIINITYDEEIKLEDVLDDDYDVKLESDDFMSDKEDNEPLIVHRPAKKTTKKTTKKKVIKVSKKRKRETDSSDDGDADVKLETQQESKPEGKRSKKEGAKKKAEQQQEDEINEEKPVRRGGRKKNPGLTADEVRMEEYVTISRLTLEQQITEVETRRSSSNYVNSEYKCDLCYKGFVEEQCYKNHMNRHDPRFGSEVCVVCKVRFKTARDLRGHASKHEKKYSCKSCDYVCKTSSQAKKHQKWHEGVTYKCQYCGEVSSKWTSYMSHLRIKHPSEYICGACGYSYVSKLGLSMHKTMMHRDLKEESITGPYCKDCSVQFLNEEAFKRHMVTSVKHKFVNGCRVCGSSFNTAEELRLHSKEHASKKPDYKKRGTSQDWPIKCEHCDVMIYSARENYAHYRRAHPTAKYPILPIGKLHICEICGKGFRHKPFLTYHKRTHSSVREFRCGQCPKSFYNRTNLLLHERTHSDHRPHLCILCGKAFKSKGALNRHSRSHTGVKPYECEFCGKAFSQSNSCKLHVRTVHLKLPAPYPRKAQLQRRRDNITNSTLHLQLNSP